MKTKLRNIYRCDHCNKYYISKYHAERHEKYCRENPNNQHACFKDCKHLTSGQDEEGKYFTCDITGKSLFSYRAEATLHYASRDGFHKRMPLECEHYVIMSFTEMFKMN